MSISNGMSEAALKQKVVSLIDLTSLNDNDSETSLAAFFKKAHTLAGPVAAVCIAPHFVRLAANEFNGSPIKIATVANFPQGVKPLTDVLVEINDALEDGAQEIDVVFPYQNFLAGAKTEAGMFVETCKAACNPNTLLKVILETGAIREQAKITEAAEIAFAAGANFVKTSTGKIPAGASLEAAERILQVIRKNQSKTQGLKVSGGIHELSQALQYIELAERIMGKGWISPQTFRIGTSRFLVE